MTDSPRGLWYSGHSRNRRKVHWSRANVVHLKYITKHWPRLVERIPDNVRPFSARNVHTLVTHPKTPPQTWVHSRGGKWFVQDHDVPLGYFACGHQVEPTVRWLRTGGVRTGDDEVITSTHEHQHYWSLRTYKTELSWDASLRTSPWRHRSAIFRLSPAPSFRLTIFRLTPVKSQRFATRKFIRAGLRATYELIDRLDRSMRSA